jgi:hypothetical protein
VVDGVLSWWWRWWSGGDSSNPTAATWISQQSTAAAQAISGKLKLSNYESCPKSHSRRLKLSMQDLGAVGAVEVVVEVQKVEEEMDWSWTRKSFISLDRRFDDADAC